MITAAQGKGLSLAVLMYAKVNALRATDSGAQNAWRNFWAITRAGERSVSNYLPDSPSCAGGCGVHHTAIYKLPHRNKKGLRSEGIPVYGYSAPAKSGARIGVLLTLKATHDAPSVFFCAVSLTHLFFERWYIIQRLSRAMVAQAGASSEAPVSFRAGYANPVWATTSEIGVSGGSVTRYLKEVAECWLLPPPQNRLSSGLSPLFAATARQSQQKSTISPQNASAKHVAHWHASTSPFLRAGFLSRRCAVFKIILTTTEYFNGTAIHTDVAQYYLRYKTRKAAERNAARMCETVAMPGSPVKYITVAEVIHA